MKNTIKRSKKLIIGQCPNLSYSDRIEISTPAPLVKNTGLLSLRIQWIPQKSQKIARRIFTVRLSAFSMAALGDEWAKRGPNQPSNEPKVRCEVSTWSMNFFTPAPLPRFLLK